MKRYIKSAIERDTGSVKRFTEYKGHVIYYDTENGRYRVAIKRDGTNSYYNTYQQAMKAIDTEEEESEKTD